MRISVLLATLLASIALPVFAQQAGGAPSMDLDAIFKKLDTTGDGFVTVEEWKADTNAPPVDFFNQIDANKDGKVTLQELKSAPAPSGGGGAPAGK